MRIELHWQDPITGDIKRPILTPPIALGRDFWQMPFEIQGKPVSRLVLNSEGVSRFHLSIEWDNANLVAIDRDSKNGIYINGNKQKLAILAAGDVITVGNYQITVVCLDNSSEFSENFLQKAPHHRVLNPSLSQSAKNASQNEGFPPAFFEKQQVSIAEIYDANLSVKEVEYLTVGAGLGSFVFADLLRIGGVGVERIAAVGIGDRPYSKYQQLCRNSQIPDRERLRSNSDSCPDNIWGFPSYAWREAWHDLREGNIGHSLYLLWQVAAEPAFIQTYTPKSGNVFASIDREAKRIGWDKIYHYGRVLSLRKTEDGRYVIAYSCGDRNKRERAFLIARYVHLAIGYPSLKFLPDLQEYREKTQDFHGVVNAYENHERIYQQLQQFGGTILIRGRGIVASRIIQKISEIRQFNPKIQIIHLMRYPKARGNKFGRSQRLVDNHFEFQPFNWPKSCWGGEMRAQLEKADPEQRKKLITIWGGTTTADRKDWRILVEKGLQEGWYRQEFGEVIEVLKEADRVLTKIENRQYNSTSILAANYIIDATGLDADVTTSPLLNDLVKHYNLPLNNFGRFTVSNSFELREMRNDRGKIYASGATTLGGPHAAVDSFLGLQFAALAIMDSLAKYRASGLTKLNPWASLQQWWKWATNQQPDRGSRKYPEN
jgi:pSer/pThr/pTyr-binding forkhead associated (FHA) protein